MSINDSYLVKNPNLIITPSLLFYPKLINENIKKMISLVDGGINQLRPHVKTHKSAEVIKLHLRKGIYKFKCATIAEVEMVAEAGGKDILLAFQPTVINIQRLLKLVVNYPNVVFSTIIDNPKTLKQLSEISLKNRKKIQVFVDIDCGMQRTGIKPGDNVVDLFQMIKDLPGTTPAGLHIYDGHIHHSTIEERKNECKLAFEKVLELIRNLESKGFEVLNIVAGGTPTFIIHSKNKDWEVSPGTSVLWDWGYEKLFPDLPFKHAATLLTRVISKPDEKLICLDLGYKSIASEQPQPRVNFPQLSSFEVVNHSEEHMVINTEEASSLEVGDVLYGIPQHICPTCCLYEEALIVEGNEVINSWEITARNKKITF
ncbi:MAG: D-TA family PLP-dependent enzyme [Flammeovirgaceae bacterium]|nr:D-TA family PLP-dependent enzyme [Flammeovirgaceae bacterium]